MRSGAGEWQSKAKTLHMKKAETSLMKKEEGRNFAQHKEENERIIISNI